MHAKKYYSGHHKATEKEEDQKTRGKKLEKEMRSASFKYSWRNT